MSWTNIQPTRHRILVKLDPQETHIGFLLRPDYWREQPVSGTVHAVGPGDEHGRCAINAGDRVAFGKYNGIAIDPPTFDPEGTWYVLDANPKYVVKNIILPNGEPCPGQEVYGIIEAET